MSGPTSSNLWPLLNAVCDSTLAETQVEELAALLNSDSAVRKVFLSHVQLRRNIWLLGRAERVRDLGLARVHATLPPSPPSPTLSFLSNTFYATIGYFSHEIPFSFLIGAALTSLLVLVAWLVPVSSLTPIPKDSSSMPSVAKRQFAPESKMEMVGKITGMADVKWADINTSTETGNGVPLGRKFALTSGLMEITYNTGARVILQGPVTYEVESKNGGFLPVGKLTGKVEDKAAKGFTVRTPTATVTDLGTEFGVEVNRDGVTETHIFVGMVKVTAEGGQSNGRKEQFVCAGKAIRIDAKGNQFEVTQTNERQFVRALPSQTQPDHANSYAELVLSMKPVVYYRMEEWPQQDKKGYYTLFDSAPGGHHGDVHVDETYGPPWAQGKFGRTLDLHSPSVGDYVFVPDYPKAENGQLSVSAWARAVTLSPCATIVQNYSSLVGPNRTGQFFFGVSTGLDLFAIVKQKDGIERHAREGTDKDEPPVLPRGVWQHVAFVADGAMLRLYRNGIEVHTRSCQGVACPPLPKRLGIGFQMDKDGVLAPNYFGQWNGQLDEIAVFNHALSAEQVRQLYMGTSRPSGKAN